MIHPILLLLIISSCGPSEDVDCHKQLFFQNNKDEVIYLIWTEKVIAGDKCDNFIRGEIEPLSKIEILGSNNSCVEKIINNRLNGAVVIYVFEKNPNITECDSVAAHPDIIKRMEFTVVDLNALSWVIQYP